MLRLRTSDGIEAGEYSRRFLLPFEPLQKVLANNRALGYVGINDEGRWHLTPKGYLISNSIITDLLVAQDESIPMRRL